MAASNDVAASRIRPWPIRCRPAHGAENQVLICGAFGGLILRQRLCDAALPVALISNNFNNAFTIRSCLDRACQQPTPIALGKVSRSGVRFPRRISIESNAPGLRRICLVQEASPCRHRRLRWHLRARSVVPRVAPVVFVQAGLCLCIDPINRPSDFPNYCQGADARARSTTRLGRLGSLGSLTGPGCTPWPRIWTTRVRPD